MPWAYIASLQTEITGFKTAGTNFGRPGFLSTIFAGIAAILFLIPRIWSKRVNVIIGAIGLAWSIRNYLLVGTCAMGECPEKRPGLHLLLFLSVGVLLMTFLPRIPVKNNNTPS